MRMLLFVLILGLQFACSRGSDTDVAFPKYQLQALETLYNSTNGEHWLWKTNHSNISQSQFPFDPDVNQGSFNMGSVWNFTATANPCLDNWQGIKCNGTGICDTENEWNCNITDIELVYYNLTGTIPPDIASLTTLEGLDLSGNQLEGAIPFGLGQMSKMKHFSVGINKLSGPLPLDLFGLSYLRALLLEFNSLSGSIPPELGSLQSLSSLGLGFNCFSGSLPSTLGTLSELEWLDCQRNSFTGTVPSSFGDLAKVRVVDFSTNRFTGSFPAATVGAGTHSLLGVLEISKNIFSSDLDWLGTYTSLAAIYLESNQFSGLLPSSVGGLSGLSYLMAYDNCLYGTLPSSLATLYHLQHVFIHNNLFSGSIPPGLSSNIFRDFDATNNFLTGKLDALVGASSYYLQLSIGFNMFTGTLPSHICLSGVIIQLRVNNNAMTGLTPSCIGSLTDLTFLDMSTNYFTGYLPEGMVNMRNLSTLLVRTNFFSGSLSSALPSDALVTLDVNDNGFTGDLPYNVFSPRLEAFIAAKNCFHGPISSAICSSVQLQVLDISGLTAGSSCAAPQSFLGLNFYFATTIAGTLPACITELPALMQLYAAGNGITSSISHLNVSVSLVNMSLANNRLIGSLPLTLQQGWGSFQMLDMSYNHIKGTVQEMTAESTIWPGPAASNRSLRLVSNRLSGLIPASFTDSPIKMNILEGNMFQCVRTSELPQSDADCTRYICGSGILDPMWVAYNIVIVVAAMTLAYLLRFGSSVLQLRAALNVCVQYFVWGPSNRSGNPTIDSLATTLYGYRKMVGLIGGIIVLLLMPIFVVLKYADYNNRTHTFQYGWIVSLSFLHHEAASITVAILWLLAMCMLVVYEFVSTPDMVVNLTVKANAHKEGSVMGFVKDVKDNYQRNVTICSLLLFNTAVALVLNGLFVYITLSQPLHIIRLFSVLVVIFKLTWNFGVVVPRLDALRCKFVVELGVVIFNNILAPVLATMAVDVSCFQQLLVEPAPITNPYTYQACSIKQTIIVDVIQRCVEYTTQSNLVSFAPPFIYSSQCSSAIVSVYTPVFIASHGLVGIVVPLIQFGVMRYFSVSVKDSGGSCSRARRLLVTLKANIRQISSLSNNIITEMVLPIESLDDLKEFVHCDQPVPAAAGGIEDPSAGTNCLCAAPGSRLFYRSRHFVLNNLLILVLLVTFGLAYPPLALMLLINITVTSLVMQACIHAHHVHLAASPALAPVFEVWKGMLAVEMRNFRALLYGSRSVIMLSSSTFLSLFVYDMTGIAKPRLAVGLIVCLIALPYLTRVVFRRLMLKWSQYFLPSVVRAEVNKIELTALRHRHDSETGASAMDSSSSDDDNGRTNRYPSDYAETPVVETERMEGQISKNPLHSD